MEPLDLLIRPLWEVAYTSLAFCFVLFCFIFIGWRKPLLFHKLQHLESSQTYLLPSQVAKQGVIYLFILCCLSVILHERQTHSSTWVITDNLSYNCVLTSIHFAHYPEDAPALVNCKVDSFPSYSDNHGLSINKHMVIKEIQFSAVQSLSCVQLFATPWAAARQASLSISNSLSLPKLMSIESVMPSNHLILFSPLLFLPSIFPSIRVFSNESALHIRWPKY